MSRLEGSKRRGWILKNSEEPILEVGAQEGEIFKDSPYSDVHLVDVDRYETPFPFTQADAHDLPFDENSFKTIVLAEILEHVRNPVKVLKEAKRVSSNRVLITCPDEYRWAPRAKPFTSIDERLRETNETLEEYYERETKDVIERGGDPHQIFHRRHYTGERLSQQLEIVFGKKFRIGHLEENPFAFWVSICFT